MKLPEEIIKSFKEKASLVFLSIANSLTKEKVRAFIFNEPKKLNNLIKTLKKLSNKITFTEPLKLFFEKKKIQVLRKLIEFLISIFMDIQPTIPVGSEDKTPLAMVANEYHPTLFGCRLMMIYLWNKLAKIKLDYKNTTRYKALVKDQLKVHKGKMLDTFRGFWNMFMHVGQSWKAIKGSMTKQFQNFIKLSNQKAIILYMNVIADTLAFEYKSTKDIFDTSSSIFKVFYELSLI